MTTTCTAMLDRMLDADLGELCGRGDTVVAMHVRQCARCRAVANQLARDTEALGQLVRSVHRRPRVAIVRADAAATRRVSTAALLAVAAGLVVVMIRPWRDGVHETPIAAIALQPATVVASSNDVARSHSSGTSAVRDRMSSSTRGSDRDAPRRRVSPRAGYREPVPAVEVAAITVAPTVVAAADRAIPVAPVKLDVAPRQALGSDVTVDPPAGKRADIIRTGRPGVTVVWLY